MNMMNKCAKFHKDSPSGKKKLNSISRVWLNFRRRPILCTTLYRNPMQASNFGGTFDQLFLWIFFMQFSQKMRLYFFCTMVQKSQKWPKTQIKGGGSCLKWPQQSIHQSITSFSTHLAINDKLPLSLPSSTNCPCSSHCQPSSEQGSPWLCYRLDQLLLLQQLAVCQLHAFWEQCTAGRPVHFQPDNALCGSQPWNRTQ